jgi:transposase, IS5 family
MPPAYFNSVEYRVEILDILEKSKLKSNKKTGRFGMDLWQIFVLSEFRNVLYIDYDQLMHMANEDKLVRSMMGLYRVLHPEKDDIQYPYQTIVDNVKLLD